jgi:hypothetical protein
MIQPQNFWKINDYTHVDSTNEIEFHFEVGMNSTDTTTELWVFDEIGKYMGDYCTLFTIDWKNNQYYARKCVKGDGYSGEDITGVFYISRSVCESMNSFIEHIKDNILKFSKLYLYLN